MPIYRSNQARVKTRGLPSQDLILPSPRLAQNGHMCQETCQGFMQFHRSLPHAGQLLASLCLIMQRHVEIPNARGKPHAEPLAKCMRICNLSLILNFKRTRKMMPGVLAICEGLTPGMCQPFPAICFGTFPEASPGWTPRFFSQE